MPTFTTHKLQEHKFLTVAALVLNTLEAQFDNIDHIAISVMPKPSRAAFKSSVLSDNVDADAGAKCFFQFLMFVPCLKKETFFYRTRLSLDT